MSSSSPHPLLPRAFSGARVRRRITLFLAFAVLFAGIAQAAHYHKDQLTGQSQTDVHCLLCLFAGGNAGPPAPIQAARPVAPRYCGYRYPACSGRLTLYTAASYDARGPPVG
jgi:hypothetical protein